MSERDPAEEMISELGIAPGLDVDSDQRAELLQRWHEADAEKAAERKRKEHDERKKP
jgi:hypothetical protein